MHNATHELNTETTFDVGPVSISHVNLPHHQHGYNVVVNDGSYRIEAASFVSMQHLSMADVIARATDYVFLWIPSQNDPGNVLGDYRDGVLALLRKTLTGLIGNVRCQPAQVRKTVNLPTGTMILSRYYDEFTDQIVTTAMHYPTLAPDHEPEALFSGSGQCQMRMSPSWIDPGPFG